MGCDLIRRLLLVVPQLRGKINLVIRYKGYIFTIQLYNMLTVEYKKLKVITAEFQHYFENVSAFSASEKGFYTITVFAEGKYRHHYFPIIGTSIIEM